LGIVDNFFCLVGAVEMKQLLKIFLIKLSIVASCYGYDFKLISISELMKLDSNIKYLAGHDVIPFLFNPFSISIFPHYQPHRGLYDATFVLKIPQGQVLSDEGWIVVDNCVVRDFLPQNHPLVMYTRTMKQMNPMPVKKISGKVAVITRIDTQYYGHWLRDVLCRLVLLEQQGIEYDWLYVPCDKNYMKETLCLWGVDMSKIIEPKGEYEHIQADELIVPSLTVRIKPDDTVSFSDHIALSAYYPDWIIQELRRKFLPLAAAQASDQTFAKKIFISRQDATHRRMTNEDEVFALFKAKGFERCFLSQLSFLDQVQLFQQVEVVVGAHGTGFENLIFSQPGTRVIEIFQGRSDSTYWYLAQSMGLHYEYIQTMKFKHRIGFYDTCVPLEIVQDFLKSWQ
jgi:hypothetical protein